MYWEQYDSSASSITTAHMNGKRHAQEVNAVRNSVTQANVLDNIRCKERALSDCPRKRNPDKKVDHRCPSSLSVGNTSTISGFLTGSLPVFCCRRRGNGRVGRTSDMMSGIVDCPVTLSTGLCPSLPASKPESDEDELLSSLEDESSDSEFSLEEADEDEASVA